MSFNNQPAHIDTLLAQINTSVNQTAVNQLLKNLPKDTKESQLCGFLSNGTDPLITLDPRTSGFAVLYILSARLSASFSTVPPPPWQVVEMYCDTFNAEQARLAADRISRLAKGMVRLAQHLGNQSLAIRPLSRLVALYPHSPSYLTTIHPTFVLTCVTTRNFLQALPILEHPITEIDTTLCPDLHFTDNLVYHYTGGIALAALGRWKAAEEFFEICVTSPGTFPAALQMEALKKMRLVQLIATGEVPPLPKYTSPHLGRLFKASPYNALANAYPANPEALREIYEKEKSTFSQERNLGLVEQAIMRAPRWVLKKLTATYVTLHLSDIGRAINIDSEDAVRGLLLSMIEDGDITAQISADGTVSFSDPPAQFTKAQVDEVLRNAQTQTALLAHLEQEMAKSKEYLTKAVKATKSGDSAWAPTAEEEVFANLGANWDENVYS
ncbi:hypothetical protein D9619_011351 [Psilocybe cf. subviscida]|uniref:COP9 signalosome complex subunit 3 n=1 Tax=Psilocybe cf. subviscida TaxID=2480587 RepID=A0A8H5F5V7_9AGAR|nr:hypothetical protein D9619_011351 [Psilocybe cf. subviscida]